MPNPLGHDPWDRHPWGAAFAVDQAGRHLSVDGEYWFFKTDADGFFIRMRDGRPLGYRYRVITEPPRPGDPPPKPVNGSMETLPMSPADVAYWPAAFLTMSDGARIGRSHWGVCQASPKLPRKRHGLPAPSLPSGKNSSVRCGAG